MTRRLCKLGSAVLVVCVMLVCSQAFGADLHGSAGLKIWYQDFSYRWHGYSFADRSGGDGVLWGPHFSLDIKENVWVSGHYLTGDLEYNSNDVSAGNSDAELFAGYSWPFVDVGFGLRRWTRDVPLGFVTMSTEEVTSLGPTLFVGSGGTFGPIPFGWYVGLTWMFADFEDADADHYSAQNAEGGTGEHLNYEAGVFVSWEKFSCSFGFRGLTFYDTPTDWRSRGASLSGSYRF